MEFRELINERGWHISFEQICERKTKDVGLSIIVNKAKNPTDLLIYPHPDSNVTTLQLDFSNYVTYSVIYDDFTVWNDEEIYEGESFLIYHKSKFFDFIQRESCLPDKKLMHLSLSCIEHRVDIICYEEPTVTVIFQKP
ncbi:hypothetical protein [Psychrobacillus sp.]|uniref:hypothetical protein n=1 Tax=Psychrobacillus sp. TaxID=1871623 RepID=UPI0028BD6C60|nr:hypothetical protein [Psychrobacillus sp.]